MERQSLTQQFKDIETAVLRPEKRRTQQLTITTNRRFPTGSENGQPGFISSKPIQRQKHFREKEDEDDDQTHIVGRTAHQKKKERQLMSKIQDNASLILHFQMLQKRGNNEMILRDQGDSKQDKHLLFKDSSHSGTRVSHSPTKKDLKKKLTRKQTNYAMNDMILPIVGAIQNFTSKAITLGPKRQPVESPSQIQPRRTYKGPPRGAMPEPIISEEQSSGSSEDACSERTCTKVELFNKQQSLQPEYNKKQLVYHNQEDPNLKQLKDLEKETILNLQKKEKEQRGPVIEFIASRMIISTTNLAYQIFKMVMILISFLSSFQYAYFAAIFDQMSAREEASFRSFDMVFEFIFILDIAIKFFVEHQYETSESVERDVRVLALLYLRGMFFLDLVTTIPFIEILQFFEIESRYLKLLLLLKTLRLYNGFQLLNYKRFMNQLKKLQSKRIQRLIDSGSREARSQTTDRTRIATIVVLNYMLRAFQLVIILICLSYFTGMLWLIFCDYLLTRQEEKGIQEENFLTYFELYQGSGEHQDSHMTLTISMVYFLFTSLSTVGLGDYHPRGDGERVVGTIVILLGVLVTTFVNENLSTMLGKIRAINDSFEESDNLSLFFATMKKFNEQESLPEHVVRKMDEYFIYRWANHKNNAIQSQGERELLEQLPVQVQRDIYTNFLFKDFLIQFSPCLIFKKDALPQQLFKVLKRMKYKAGQELMTKYFDDQVMISWDNWRYQGFVVALLTKLEPKFIEPKEVVMDLEQDIHEIIFPMNGEIEVGYDLETFIKENQRKRVDLWSIFLQNMQKIEKRQTHYSEEYDELNIEDKLKSRLKNMRSPVVLTPGKLVLGLFEMSFNEDCAFIYRARQRNPKYGHNSTGTCAIDTFFIRKSLWQNLEKEYLEHSKIWDGFKTRILINYIDKIYQPIDQDREMILVRWDERSTSKDYRRLASRKGKYLGQSVKLPVQEAAKEENKVDSPGLRALKTLISGDIFKKAVEPPSPAKHVMSQRSLLTKTVSESSYLGEQFRSDPMICLLFGHLNYEEVKIEQALDNLQMLEDDARSVDTSILQEEQQTENMKKPVTTELSDQVSCLFELLIDLLGLCHEQKQTIEELRSQIEKKDNELKASSYLLDKYLQELITNKIKGNLYQKSIRVRPKGIKETPKPKQRHLPNQMLDSLDIDHSQISQDEEFEGQTASSKQQQQKNLELAMLLLQDRAEVNSDESHDLSEASRNQKLGLSPGMDSQRVLSNFDASSALNSRNSIRTDTMDPLDPEEIEIGDDSKLFESKEVVVEEEEKTDEHSPLSSNKGRKKDACLLHFNQSSDESEELPNKQFTTPVIDYVDASPIQANINRMNPNVALILDKTDSTPLSTAAQLERLKASIDKKFASLVEPIKEQESLRQIQEIQKQLDELVERAKNIDAKSDHSSPERIDEIEQRQVPSSYKSRIGGKILNKSLEKVDEEEHEGDLKKLRRSLLSSGSQDSLQFDQPSTATKGNKINFNEVKTQSPSSFETSLIHRPQFNYSPIGLPEGGLFKASTASPTNPLFGRQSASKPEFRANQTLKSGHEAGVQKQFSIPFKIKTKATEYKPQHHNSGPQIMTPELKLPQDLSFKQQDGPTWEEPSPPHDPGVIHEQIESSKSKSKSSIRDSTISERIEITEANPDTSMNCYEEDEQLMQEILQQAHIGTHHEKAWKN